MTFEPMKGYKVIFENNVPAFARIADAADSQKMVHLSTEGGKAQMNWLIVYSDNEADAMEVAAKVVDTIWREYLA